jgi:hypothetical protein
VGPAVPAAMSARLPRAASQACSGTPVPRVAARGLAVVVLCFSFLWPLPAPAQECDKETVAQKPSRWSTRGDFIGRDFGAAQLPRARAVVAALSRLVMDDVYPQPRGCNPFWYASYDSPGPYPSHRFSFISGYLMYYCKGPQSGMFVGHETETWISIAANDTPVLRGNMEVNDKQVLTLRRPDGIRDGMLYYAIPRSETSPRTKEMPVTRAWLITYPGKLPYVPVTRKEYLLEARVELARRQEKDIAAMRKQAVARPAAEQEAQKRKRIEEIERSYAGDAREAKIRRYLQDYRTDEQRNEESLASVRGNYQKTLDVMDGLLQRMPEGELAQPAIVRDPANAFKGFLDAEPNYVHMLARPNPEYFDSRLSTTTPQFFTVVALEEPRLTASRELSEAFLATFKFDRLKQMLGR